MDAKNNENEIVGIRKGPWTVDEDTILVNYITIHGEGHWNSVARRAGMYLHFIFPNFLNFVTSLARPLIHGTST